MDKPDYYVAEGGLPPQSARHWQRAIFTTSYAYIPHTVMSDIVTSYLPFWEQTRLWVLARPLSGFAESFSHYLMDIASGGGSSRPDDDKTAQHVLFVTGGQITLTYHGNTHILEPGGYAYLPAGLDWKLHNRGESRAAFHWIRKNYHAVDGIPMPEPFITSDQAVKPVAMPDTDGLWATSRFVEPDDLRHDMHVNIVTFQPGGVIPFSETHVMEHGLYVLQGQAKYLLNQDWVDVEPGDYMWLRAFCPQACEATGQTPFRYLLYKDVNRHMPLFFNHESRK